MSFSERSGHSLRNPFSSHVILVHGKRGTVSALSMYI